MKMHNIINAQIEGYKVETEEKNVMTELKSRK